MNTKKILFTAITLVAASSLYAQGDGSAGIVEATQMVTSYFDPGTKLVYAIGAVCGLIGGISGQGAARLYGGAQAGLVCP